MTQLQRVENSGEIERAKYVPKANENLQENPALNPVLRQAITTSTEKRAPTCDTRTAHMTHDEGQDEHVQ